MVDIKAYGAAAAGDSVFSSFSIIALIGNIWNICQLFWIGVRCARNKGISENFGGIDFFDPRIISSGLCALSSFIILRCCYQAVLGIIYIVNGTGLKVTASRITDVIAC